MDICPKMTHCREALGLLLELRRNRTLHPGCATETEDTGVQSLGAGWPHQGGNLADREAKEMC